MEGEKLREVKTKDEVAEGEIEKKEGESLGADLRVDFIRHGRATYTEEERKKAAYEGTLTEEGKELIKNSALELAEGIDKDKEIVVIWSSPKGRARESAEIIESVFGEKAISVLGKGDKREGKTIRPQKSLRDVSLTPEVMKLAREAQSEWFEYWTKTEELPKGVEKPEEVSERIKRAMTYLEKVARTIQPEGGKKLHFIILTHEENFKDLLEEGLGSGIKKETRPTYGERMRIDIYKSSPEKDAVFELEYRDKEAKLGFRKEERKFYRIKNE